MNYSPGIPPQSLAELPAWIAQELKNLKQAQDSAQPFVRLQVTHVAPTRVQDGDMYEVDGTNWDPGSGAGTYIRRAGAWVKLG